MCQTSHTIQTGKGQGDRIIVNHNEYEAIQYEFYFPETIWNHPSCQTFMQRLGSIEDGATIFAGLIGVWEGDSEQTRIYRMILRADRFDRSNVRTTLHSEIGSLMAGLSASANSAQDAFMFTETVIRATISSSQ